MRAQRPDSRAHPRDNRSPRWLEHNGQRGRSQTREGLVKEFAFYPEAMGRHRMDSMQGRGKIK